MIVLGLACAFSHLEKEFIPGLPRWFGHDAAAVLMQDGEVIAAVEEERLNRLKHTNKFPTGAISVCLAERGLDVDKIDRVAYFFEEEDNDKELGILYGQSTGIPIAYSRELIATHLTQIGWKAFDPQRIRFVPHHIAHAHAAFYQSGFPDALVAVIDGSGERESTSLYSADGLRIELLRAFPVSKSLGHLYSTSIELLGYSIFDEYKVMGLAPYGDTARYRHLFRECYRLMDDGGFDLEFATARSLFLRRGFRPRRRGEDFTQDHKDFAAGLQEMLETIVLHILKFARAASRHSNLCLTGGVGLNCSMNGQIVRSGLFERLFVHPASHDAGAALGAAMAVCKQESPLTFSPRRIQNVFWGPRSATLPSLRVLLASWSKFVEVEESSDIYDETAELLRGGAVVAWMQGRSEFGPRALGNRSILADPRPAANRIRINAIVKKRESYRPFAPSVLAEHVSRYFETPADTSTLEFMVVVVKVRPEFRSELGAITHVDGTARIHCVERSSNEVFWRLLEAFRECSGLPVLLNTSFNNLAEPIVQDSADAIQCLLTTGLDFLAIENFIIRKRPVSWIDWLDLTITIHPAVRLRTDSPRHELVTHEIYFSNTGGPCRSLTPSAFAILRNADGMSSLRELGAATSSVVQELRELWEHRFIRLEPRVPVSGDSLLMQHGVTQPREALTGSINVQDNESNRFV
jgi:predicted NodU family carbamoyl transferase